MAEPPVSLRRIRKLYHFTDVRNFPSIKRLDGIYSTAKLNEMDAEYYPGGDEQSLCLDVESGMDQYVHLCFCLRHPLAYRIEQRNSEAKLLYLRIDRRILSQEGVQFSNGVSYAEGVETLPIQEAVERGMIDYQVLYTYMSWDDPEVQTRRHAAELCEILIPNYVPMDFIMDFPNG